MRNIILLVTIFCLAVPVFSQEEIPNSGFEEWQEVLNSKNELMFEAITGDFWDSLNKLRLLGGPVTMEKTDDAHSGNYAVRLETKAFGTFKITGLIISGYFDSKADPGKNMMEGKPFTGTPEKLISYLKAFPKEGDSSAIYINLTRWDGNKRDTVAEASIAIGREISEYEKFELPLDYYLTGIQPDTIKVTFLSSVGGRNFTGGEGTQPQIGSAMYIDDVYLEYPSGVKSPLFQKNNSLVFVDRQQENLEVISDKNIDGKYLQIFDSKGNVLLEQTIEYPYTYNVSKYPSGAYFFNIFDDSRIFDHGNFIIMR
jgi:hypothetical protein